MLSPNAAPTAPAVPERRLSEWHAVSVCIGMVIGAGIFITTPLAAANLPSGAWVMAAWVFGGAMSLAGALCFAEMAAAFPDAGGDYNFSATRLRRRRGMARARRHAGRDRGGCLARLGRGADSSAVRAT
jgi:amino acid permease